MSKNLPQTPRRNAPWTPLQRRAWLAEQRRKKHLLPAPVLRAANPDLLQWDWDLPNPYKWQVWLSLDGGATYMMPSDYWVYGDARQFAPDGEELHYIVGVNADGREITLHSNAVKPSDAGIPADVIVLSSDGHGRLTWTLNFPSDRSFNIYLSADGVTWGASFDGAEPGARAKDENGMAGFFRICQSDADGNDVLPYSNAVHSDGSTAPDPAILLASDGHGRLTWSLNFTSPYGSISIYKSADGVTWPADTFDGCPLVPGNRDCSGVAGYFRICVADSGGHDVLPYSNVVHSDGL